MTVNAVVRQIAFVVTGLLPLILITPTNAGNGVVRAKWITLPESWKRISRPLIFLDFSGSSGAVRRPSEVFRILL
jgi:hypothetical protein